MKLFINSPAIVLITMIVMLGWASFSQDVGKTGYNPMQGHISNNDAVSKYALVIGNADYNYINKHESLALDSRAFDIKFKSTTKNLHK